MKSVSVGMDHEQLLKLAAPASSITVTDEGHVIETYQYSAKGTHLGTVLLIDGKASGAQTSSRLFRD